LRFFILSVVLFSNMVYFRYNNVEKMAQWGGLTSDNNQIEQVSLLDSSITMPNYFENLTYNFEYNETESMCVVDICRR